MISAIIKQRLWNFRLVILKFECIEISFILGFVNSCMCAWSFCRNFYYFNQNSFYLLLTSPSFNQISRFTHRRCCVLIYNLSKKFFKSNIELSTMNIVISHLIVSSRSSNFWEKNRTFRWNDIKIKRDPSKYARSWRNKFLLVLIVPFVERKIDLSILIAIDKSDKFVRWNSHGKKK